MCTIVQMVLRFQYRVNYGRSLQFQKVLTFIEEGTGTRFVF